MTEIITIINVILILLILLMLMVNPKKKPVPWNGTSLNGIKRLLFHNPKFIKLWEMDAVKFLVFPIEKKMLYAPSHMVPKPMANTIMCVGGEKSYDQYLVTKVNYFSKDTYVLDIDYLGRASGNPGISITYNL